MLLKGNIAWPFGTLLILAAEYVTRMRSGIALASRLYSRFLVIILGVRYAGHGLLPLSI
jgi:hypothetical protein